LKGTVNEKKKARWEEKKKNVNKDLLENKQKMEKKKKGEDQDKAVTW